MLRFNLFFTYLLSMFTFASLYADEVNYEDTSYLRIKHNNFNWVNLDNENAEFKLEQKQETFKYALKSNLGKYGYEDLDATSIDGDITNLYNEDLYKLGFSASAYLYDDVWVNVSINYKDSLRSTLDTRGSLAYKKKSIKQESIVKLFYQPNYFITTNISFENINNSLDYDKFTYQSFKNTNKKKLSFNINTKLDFLTINTSLFQIVKDNNYLSKTTDTDDYLNTSQEMYRGIELTLSKELFDNLKLTTSGKLTHIEILDNSLIDLIGKTPTYTPEQELNLKVEYIFKDIKFISKVTHIGSRYSDSTNSDKLNSYTIESVGATFFRKLYNEDVKIDFNIKNILNKDYYLYSDTKGDSRNYVMNLSMKF